MQLNPPDPPLTRGRVLIRPPGKGDIPAITEACQDDDIARFTRVPSPYTEQDAERFVEMSRDGWREGATANFIGIDLHTGLLVGSCGLVVDQREQAAEIGYWVAPTSRGVGVGTTMAWLVARYGFEDVGLHRLTLIASANNDRSLGIAKRLGFTLEGTLREAHIDGLTGDAKAPRVDAAIHGLLSGELRDPEEEPND
jgi:RimJ/RimL family protein N-acetyltransferase